MSAYYYLACSATRQGVRLGQGGGEMHTIYAAQIEPLVAFLNEHRGQALDFVDDVGSYFDDGLEWDLVEPPDTPTKEIPL